MGIATSIGKQIIKVTSGKSTANAYAKQQAAKTAAKKASTKALSTMSKTKLATPKSGVKVVKGGTVDEARRLSNIAMKKKLDKIRKSQGK